MKLQYRSCHNWTCLITQSSPQLPTPTLQSYLNRLLRQTMTCTERLLKERCGTGSRLNFMKSICCTKYGNANVSVDFAWKVTDNLPPKSMDRYRTQSHGSQTSSYWDTHDGDSKKISFHNCFLTFGTVALSGQVLPKMMNLSCIQLKCSGSAWKQRTVLYSCHCEALWAILRWGARTK